MASGPGYKILEEKVLPGGFCHILTWLSDQGLGQFCSWKGGWNNSKDYVEKKSGARLELRSSGTGVLLRSNLAWSGNLVIVGKTIAAKKARNMIQGYMYITSKEQR